MREIQANLNLSRVRVQYVYYIKRIIPRFSSWFMYLASRLSSRYSLDAIRDFYDHKMRLI